MVEHLAHRVKIHHPDLSSVKFYQLHKPKTYFIPSTGRGTFAAASATSSGRINSAVGAGILNLS
jgi:hypothetical protein